MDILIVGGGKFVGRAITEAALHRGHSLTLFNRGRSSTQLGPWIRHLVGDRGGDLTALAKGRWDVVIDTCGYFPRDVDRLAQAVKAAVDRYIFISSGAVYRQPQLPPLDEDAQLVDAEADDNGTLTEQNYGTLKVACEKAVSRIFRGRDLIVRPGFIVGPYDHTGRFAYWLRRISEGGDVLSPEPRNHPCQLVDARDLADWIVRAIEDDVRGTFNVTGPHAPLTWEGLLNAVCGQLSPTTHLQWVADDWLLRRGILAADLPLWFPGSPDRRGLLSISSERAIGKGLTLRPLAHTVTDTFEWIRTTGSSGSVGLSRKREARLLSAWTRNRVRAATRT